MSSWLIDKSALVRLPSSPDFSLWMERADRALIAITTPTVLESGFSARSMADWHALVEGPPVSRLLIERMSDASERRAVEVQGMLAGRGLHRAPSVPDLLIAAVAEVNGHVLLHVDKDFELIAEVTGQPIERLGLLE